MAASPSFTAAANFRQSLNQVIRAAWPEVDGPTHPILRVTQAKRYAWRNLTDQAKKQAAIGQPDPGGLEYPWIVTQVPPPRSEEGWGACNVVYRPMVTVTFITSNVGHQDLAQFVEEKLCDLETTLARQAYTGFQYWPGETAHDVTDDNPANGVFLSSNIPMFAGSLTFRAMYGYHR